MAGGPAAIPERQDAGDQPGQRAGEPQPADPVHGAAGGLRAEVRAGGAVGVLPAVSQQVQPDRAVLGHPGAALERVAAGDRQGCGNSGTAKAWMRRRDRPGTRSAHRRVVVAPLTGVRPWSSLGVLRYRRSRPRPETATSPRGRPSSAWGSIAIRWTPPDRLATASRPRSRSKARPVGRCAERFIRPRRGKWCVSPEMISSPAPCGLAWITSRGASPPTSATRASRSGVGTTHGPPGVSRRRGGPSGRTDRDVKRGCSRSSRSSQATRFVPSNVTAPRSPSASRTRREGLSPGTSKASRATTRGGSSPAPRLITSSDGPGRCGSPSPWPEVSTRALRPSAVTARSSG